MSAIIYLYIFFIILGSSMIQGITSFGFSLLAVPLLSLVIPLKVIVPMLVVYSLFINIIIYKNVKGHINKIQILILIIFGVISIPIGTIALKNIDENIIKGIVGIIIIISSIAMNFGYKIEFKNKKIAYGLTGFLSGILNGSTSLSGPPVILLLSNENTDKDNFRKTLSTYFLVLNIFTIPIFVYERILTKDIIVDIIKLSPALFIGVTLGIVLGNRINEKIFSKITILLIFTMGILTSISAF